MRIKDIKSIFKWVDDYSIDEIARFTGINPDIIETIKSLKELKADLEIYA